MDELDELLEKSSQRRVLRFEGYCSICDSRICIDGGDDEAELIQHFINQHGDEVYLSSHERCWQQDKN